MRYRGGGKLANAVLVSIQHRFVRCALAARFQILAPLHFIPKPIVTPGAYLKPRNRIKSIHRS
jgi:hypothetical protein